MSIILTKNDEKNKLFLAKKLRNLKIFRKITPSKNTDNIEVFEIYPPPAIKGAFREGGGFNFKKNFLIVGFDTEFWFDVNKNLGFLTYQFYIPDKEVGYLFVCKSGNKIAFKDVLLFFKDLYKVREFVFIAHFGVVDYLKFLDFKSSIKPLMLDSDRVTRMPV